MKNKPRLCSGKLNRIRSNALGATEIRAMCPLIVIDKVQAGDVLLTRGKGVESALIAYATHGFYSHAALWLPFELYDDDGTLIKRSISLVESDDSGIGETSLQRVTLIRKDVSVTKCFRLAEAAKFAEVRRHINIDQFSLQRLTEDAQKLRKSDFYKAYSDLRRLAEATRMHPAFQSIVKMGLHAIDKSDDELTRGSFCSELIAKYYENLGIPVIIGNKAANFINPNDFVLGESFFSVVSLAVLNAGDINDSDTGITSEHYSSADERTVYLPAMVRFQSRADRADEAAQVLMSQLDHMAISSHKQSIAVANRQFVRAKENWQQALVYDDLRAMIRFERIAEKLLLVIEINNKKLKRRTQIDEKMPISPAVSLRLTKLCYDISGQCDREFFLTFCLMKMRRLRISYAQHKDNISASQKFKIEQREIIDIWIGAKKSQYDLDGLFDFTFKSLDKDKEFVDIGEFDEILADVVRAVVMN